MTVLCMLANVFRYGFGVGSSWQAMHANVADAYFSNLSRSCKCNSRNAER